MKHYTGIDFKKVKKGMVAPPKNATKEDKECELRLIFHVHACTLHLQFFFTILNTHFVGTCVCNIQPQKEPVDYLTVFLDYSYERDCVSISTQSSAKQSGENLCF